MGGRDAARGAAGGRLRQMTGPGNPPDSRPSRLRVRPAVLADAPAISDLIDASIRGIGAERYDPRQIESSLAHLFGVDTRMIEDGTYYVVEEPDGRIVGAGGWSRRRTPFGGDQASHFRDAGLREPGRDAAVIRAFYVHPDRARRGIGRLLMEASEGAAQAEGYRRFELVATLTGIPLYAACGYQEVEPVGIELPDGVVIEAVRMERDVSRDVTGVSARRTPEPPRR